jgi:preprotein translocase subunit YajC
VLSLLPFLLIIVVFWFLLIRPQQKRQREAQQMQSELAAGSKVMLTSGIFGTVTEITDDHIGIEIADGVAIKVVRAAIGRILPDDFGQAEPGDDTDAQTGTATDVDSHEAGAAGESADETLARYTPKSTQPEQND